MNFQFTFDDDLINMTINAILNFNSTGDVQAPSTKPTYNVTILENLESSRYYKTPF